MKRLCAVRAEVFEDYAEVNAKVPPDIVMTVLSNEDIGYLADYIASNTTIQLDDKQFILEQTNPQKRLEAVISLLIRETEILKTDEKIGREVAANIDDNQREYYMREQLKVLNEELYGSDDPNKEADEYNKKIDALKAPDEVKEKLKSEVSHLAKMPSGSQEATVVRGYLDCCIALPWGIYSNEKINIAKSRKILDRDHYGLKKVKERMIELLSVHALQPDIKGQIICLAGLPESVKLQSHGRLPNVWAENMRALRWAAWAMRLKYAPPQNLYRLYVRQNY